MFVSYIGQDLEQRLAHNYHSILHHYNKDNIMMVNIDWTGEGMNAYTGGGCRLINL